MTPRAEMEKPLPTGLRTLGARRPATRAAHGKTLRGLELLVVQTVRLPDDDEPLAEKLREQATALTRIRQPNVASLREVIDGPGGDEGSLVFVTEFVDGVTFGDLVRIAAEHDLDLPLGVHLRILLDALTGLGAIHGARDRHGKALGRFHGDVATENIVVGLDGVSKLVSWCAGGTSGETSPDHVRFMAPEVLLGDDTADLRVDLYAIGVLLYEALSGRRIFHDTGAGAILAKHLAGKLEPPSVPDAAKWAAPLVALVQRAISTDPAQRQATSAELAAELRRIAGTHLASTSTVAALVKQLAGPLIAKRRAELAPAGVTSAPPVVRATKPDFARRELENPQGSEAGRPPPLKPKVTAMAIAPPVMALPVSAPPVVAPPISAPPISAPPVVPSITEEADEESFRLDLLESEPPPPPAVFVPIAAPRTPEPEPPPPPELVLSPEVTMEGASSIAARRRRRRGAVVALLAIAAVILLYAGVRAVSRRSTDDEPRDKPVAAVDTKASVTHAPAAVTAAAIDTAAATTTTTETPSPTTAKTAAPPSVTTATAAANPTTAPTTNAAATGTGAGTGTAATATKVTPKSKPTYDPLGI